MATGGFDPREDRRMRRDLVREEQLRATMQMSLEDKGVMLDEEDIPDIRIGQDGAQMPEDMISVQDYNAYDNNTETDNERSEEEATLPHSSSEIKDRTDKFQKEKAQYEEKEDELQRRERLVKEQEYDLENRRAALC